MGPLGITVVKVSCRLSTSKYPPDPQPALAAHLVAGPAALVRGASRTAVSIAPASAALTVPALWLTGAERSLLLVGLSVALGGLAGRGVTRQYLAREDTPAAPAPPPAPWALRGSLIGVAASAALLVTALAGPGVAASLGRPPAPVLGSSATGVIAAAELVCFAAAAILLRLRQAGWSVLPLLGVVLAEAIRAHPEGMIPVAGAMLTCCHLLPAVLWVGMLVYTARAAIAWRAYPQSAQGLFRLYGAVAGWLSAVVVVTGVFSALRLVPTESLMTTTYGRFLIAKAALVAAAAALALFGRAGLRYPAQPGAGLPLVTRLEIVALAAVLAATGLLTVLTPPAKPVFPAAARFASQPAKHPRSSGTQPVADLDRQPPGSVETSSKRIPEISAGQLLAAQAGVDRKTRAAHHPSDRSEITVRSDQRDLLTERTVVLSALRCTGRPRASAGLVRGQPG